MGSAPAIATPPPTATADVPLDKAPKPYTDQGVRVHGKLKILRSNNRVGFCSGTVVKSEGKSLVWTAAHCIPDDTDTVRWRGRRPGLAGALRSGGKRAQDA